LLCGGERDDPIQSVILQCVVVASATLAFCQGGSPQMRIASFQVFVRDLDRAAAFFQVLLQRRISAEGREHGYAVFDGAPEARPWVGLLATLRDPAGKPFQLVQSPR
jgi:hypothetical protein